KAAPTRHWPPPSSTSASTRWPTSRPTSRRPAFLSGNDACALLFLDHMLIPAIDLKGGQVVQLVQGKRLALATDDWEGWLERFAAFPKLQLIDLDAAMETGANEPLMQAICARRAC